MKSFMIIFAIPNLSTCLLLSYSCYTGRSTYLRTFRINSSLEVSNDVLRVRYRSSIQKAMVGQAYIILGGAGSALGPSRPSDLKKRAENTAQGDEPNSTVRSQQLLCRRLRNQLNRGTMRSRCHMAREGESAFVKGN